MSSAESTNAGNSYSPTTQFTLIPEAAKSFVYLRALCGKGFKEIDTVRSIF